MAYILEETKGVLPVWLAPTQVNIIPVNNEYHLEYAEEVKVFLEECNIRVELDAREEKLGYRMRESQTRKIPYNLILGDKEKEEGFVSYRLHGSNETTTLSKDELCASLQKH